jgi:hypothetical protein
MFLSLFGYPTALQNDPKMLNISFSVQARQQKLHLVYVPEVLKWLNPELQESKLWDKWQFMNSWLKREEKKGTNRKVASFYLSQNHGSQYTLNQSYTKDLKTINLHVHNKTK